MFLIHNYNHYNYHRLSFFYVAMGIHSIILNIITKKAFLYLVFFTILSLIIFFVFAKPIECQLDSINKYLGIERIYHHHRFLWLFVLLHKMTTTFFNIYSDDVKMRWGRERIRWMNNTIRFSQFLFFTMHGRMNNWKVFIIYLSTWQVLIFTMIFSLSRSLTCF